MKLGKFSSKGRSAYKRESSLPGLKLLILFVVLSFVMMTVYAREGSQGPLHAARGLVANATAPVGKVGSVVMRPISGLGNVYRNATADQETLTELQNQNAQLRSAVERLEEYKQQSQRLEKLLDLKNTYDLTSTAARVIGGSSDDWSRTIEIDKGSSSGIAINMPVINAYGLIGQVIKVGATTATVRLITDEQSGVSAMLQKTRTQGIVRGAPDGTLRLDYIPAEATVEKGDVVITSGMGGVYPKGLPIGEVSALSKSPSSLYYEITVKQPFVQSAYEEVLVITKLNDPDKQPIAAIKKPTVEEGMAPLKPGEDQGQTQEGAQGSAAASQNQQDQAAQPAQGAQQEQQGAQQEQQESQGTEGGQQ